VERLMTAIVTPQIHYPTGDGQPVEEVIEHLYAILIHRLQAGLIAERSRSEELQATLDRYREQFGEL
jgi:hypothetical protein